MQYNNEHKIAILGAGFTGLTTAYYLNKFNKDINISIFESKEIGGQVQTEIYEDCIIEKGPETFQMRIPLLNTLCEELDIKDKMIIAKKDAAKRYILKEGQLIKVPMSLLSFLTSSILPFTNKVKIAFALKKKFSLWPGMSFYDATKNIFGEPFAQYPASAVARGVYGTEAEDLEFSSAFQDVYISIQETDSLMKAIKKMVSEKKNFWVSQLGANSYKNFQKGMYSFEGGLKTIIEKIRENLKNKNIKIENAKIQRITCKKNEYYVHTKHSKFGPFNEIISTVSPSELSEIIKELDKKISVRLNEMKYSPMTVVVHAWDKKNFYYPGFGFLAPRKEKTSMMGTLFSSNIFSHKAPEHLFLTKTMVAGDSEIFSDEEVSAMQVEGLKRLFKIEKPPIWTKIYRYKQGMPKYFLGYHEWKESIISMLNEFKGIHLTGWHFSGMGLSDALSSSYQFALKYSEKQK
ncbi:MAG: protoporphyrinogen oxidase [Spirochaetia bacterium]|nr:protoporphyrinogen oxidase [Spirochaetia bacterium]